jgi:hypothetical protein
MKYWIASVNNEGISATELVKREVFDAGIWAISNKSTYKNEINDNDRICWYAVKVGIIASGKIASKPKKLSEEQKQIIKTPEINPLIIELYKNETKDLSRKPIVLSPDLRIKLDVYEHKVAQNWGWLLSIGLYPISKEDFSILTDS